MNCLGDIKNIQKKESKKSIEKENEEYYSDCGFDKAVEYSDFENINDNENDIDIDIDYNQKQIMNDNDEIEDYFERKKAKKDNSIDDKSIGSKIVRPMSAKYKTADQKN